jgi:hypothetical protein
MIYFQKFKVMSIGITKKVISKKTLSSTRTTVAEQHRFDAAPALGKIFYVAPAAPASTLL